MPTQDAFQQVAEQYAQQPTYGLVGEFFSFLMHNKKWWLLPVVLVIALLAVLMFASQSAVAPFVYTLF
jgi:hypothetical protein